MKEQALTHNHGGKMNLNKMIIGAAVAAFMAISGWVLVAVADIPKEYVPKADFHRYQEENREDHKEISEKLDHIIETIYQLNKGE